VCVSSSPPDHARHHGFGKVARAWRARQGRRRDVLPERPSICPRRAADFLPFIEREFPHLAARYRETYEKGIHLSRCYKDALADKPRIATATA